MSRFIPFSCQQMQALDCIMKRNASAAADAAEAAAKAYTDERITLIDHPPYIDGQLLGVRLTGDLSYLSTTELRLEGNISIDGGADYGYVDVVLTDAGGGIYTGGDWSYDSNTETLTDILTTETWVGPIGGALSPQEPNAQGTPSIGWLFVGWGPTDVLLHTFDGGNIYTDGEWTYDVGLATVVNTTFPNAVWDAAAGVGFDLPPLVGVPYGGVGDMRLDDDFATKTPGWLAVDTNTGFLYWYDVATPQWHLVTPNYNAPVAVSGSPYVLSTADFYRLLHVQVDSIDIQIPDYLGSGMEEIYIHIDESLSTIPTISAGVTVIRNASAASSASPGQTLCLKRLAQNEWLVI